jgi:zinc/manganese transport system permease protein
MSSDVLSVFSQHFMVNAIIGGILIAVTASFLGYFVIIRNMTFATHALGHIGIPGATLAVLLGISPVWGLGAFCLIGGIAIAIIGKELLQRDVVTGTTLAFALALGLFFSSLSSKAAKTMQAVLFGQIMGVTNSDLILFVILSIIIILVVIFIYRPLLFTSINPDVAKTKGINVILYNFIFILLLSLLMVMSITVLGGLLPFALVVTPSAAALTWSANPKVVIGISAVFSVFSVLLGLFFAVIFNLPPSFPIVATSVVIWAFSRLWH